VLIAVSSRVGSLSTLSFKIPRFPLSVKQEEFIIHLHGQKKNRSRNIQIDFMATEKSRLVTDTQTNRKNMVS
jgi:hypothetical protein